MLTKIIDCHVCSGSGKCHVCRGSGIGSFDHRTETHYGEYRPCGKCKAGWYAERGTGRCSRCNGTGKEEVMSKGNLKVMSVTRGDSEWQVPLVALAVARANGKTEHTDSVQNWYSVFENSMLNPELTREWFRMYGKWSELGNAVKLIEFEDQNPPVANKKNTSIKSISPA